MSRNARVWIVTELYYPEQTSTGYFLTGIAESLAGRWDVHVLCSQPTYALRGTRVPIVERRHGVTIRRCISTALDKNRLASRVVNMLTISLSLGISAARNVRRGDCVLVVTNPPALVPLIALVCWLRRARSILLVHDVYPDVLAVTGLLERGNMLYRLAQRLAGRVYRQFDRIIVLGRDMQALVARTARLDPDALAIVPNWGDVRRIQPASRDANGVRARLGLQDRFIVEVLGNMGRTHALMPMLDAAAELLAGAPAVHFLFVGDGAQADRIRDESVRRALTNVTVVGSCEDDALSEYLAAANLSAIALLPGMRGISVPSRMYNILASGRPLLAVCEGDTELALVVHEEAVGWVISPTDSGAIARAIVEASNHPALMHSMGLRARAAAEAHYSFPAVAARYAEIVGAEMEQAT